MQKDQLTVSTRDPVYTHREDAGRGARELRNRRTPADKGWSVQFGGREVQAAADVDSYAITQRQKIKGVRVNSASESKERRASEGTRFSGGGWTCERKEWESKCAVVVVENERRSKQRSEGRLVLTRT